jgi:outer membrane protein assembly factor BamA
MAVGAEVDPADFQQAAARLLETGEFAAVHYRYRPVPGGVSLDFQVSDTDKLMVPAFPNFVWIGEAELLSLLRSRVPLFDGRLPVAGNEANQVAKAVEGLLKERGIDGRVTLDFSAARAGMSTVNFRVEGVRIVVRNVKFLEAPHINAEALNRIGGGLVGEEYDRPLLQRYAHANLNLEYGQIGYLRWALEKTLVEVLKEEKDETQVQLTFSVHEGDLYRVGAFHWSGNQAFPMETLSKELHLGPGDVANAIQLEKDLAAVHQLYTTRGYARALVIPTLSFEESTHKVNYELAVREGDVYRMGKLFVTGLDAGTAANVGGAWTLKEGAVYDGAYWQDFTRSGLHNVRNAVGWNVQYKETIHDDAKPVDATLNFTPLVSH